MVKHRHGETPMCWEMTKKRIAMIKIALQLNLRSSDDENTARSFCVSSLNTALLEHTVKTL